MSQDELAPVIRRCGAVHKSRFGELAKLNFELNTAERHQVSSWIFGPSWHGPNRDLFLADLASNE
ncbi:MULTISPECIES: hypothetical protein [Bradyrhizobium]|uniref:hypothetical protein n=1 Tax=Bradyrhizobium centrosematis TaxID=1300039 RepID=UPI0021677502|nr:hypothetical protein [Bradyrhizobium centrosematis]MCS3765936.1 hypothetical protein [Bradyrhizobium centrosematis]MCS3778342.1 hypothetical protein [Bradyrhizobium centrosematis]